VTGAPDPAEAVVTPPESLPGPLHGLEVVELASEHAAWAGKLLADLGADVTLVEPPGGHATRAIGPFVDDEPGPERSLWWWHHHTSKNGVVLDLDTPAGVDLLHRLVQRSDIVLEGEQPGSLAARGIDRDAIMAASPALIWVSVSPFGQQGPRAQDPATDLTLMAGGGPVWNCGYDDHSLPPVRGLGGQAANLAGVHAATATLVAVVHRDSSGLGQHIDVNMHAGLNVTTELGSYEWLVARHTVQRQTGRHASVSQTAPTQLQAADGGYVTLGFPPRSARDYRAILDWLEELGLGSAFPDHVLLEMAVERGGISIVELGQDPIVDEIWNAGRAAMAFIATHVDARACFDGFQQRGIVCGIVNTAEEVISDPHFVARGFPVAVEHDDLGRTVTYPGAPIRFSRSPWRIRCRAPHVGEHQGAVLGPLDSTAQTAGDGGDGAPPGLSPDPPD
jgi:crotonobetainyl-CoA:carnitine CoA-transferase CaiB-like acyl-CoA transferase